MELFRRGEPPPRSGENPLSGCRGHMGSFRSTENSRRKPPSGVAVATPPAGAGSLRGGPQRPSFSGVLDHGNTENTENTESRRASTFSAPSVVHRTRGPALLLALCLFAAPAFAQEAAPEPDFSLLGDVTQKTTYSSTAWAEAATSAWAFTVDLRPRFEYGAVVFQADSTWNLPLTANLTAQIPTVVVPEAYFRVSATDSLDLTVGQKRFNLGVGQTFTVGDSLNPVMGFFDQKTGFRGATAEFSPVSWASFSGAVSTEGGRSNDLVGAGQVSFLLEQLQLTGSLVARKDVTFNPSLGASYDLFGVILTGETAAEFLPQGVRPSGLASTWKAPKAWGEPAWSTSAGARWTVGLTPLGLTDVDLTLSGEYLHWAQGWTKDETTVWKTALSTPLAPLAKAARKALPLRSQENAFFRLSLTSGTVFSLSGFAAVDLQDQSVLGQGAATWAPWDNFELSFALKMALGDSGSTWEFLDQNKTLYEASLSTTYHF